MKQTFDEKRLLLLTQDKQLIIKSEVGVKVIGYFLKSIRNKSSFKYNYKLFDYIKVAKETIPIQEEHLLHKCPGQFNSDYKSQVKQTNKKLEHPPIEVLQFCDAVCKFDLLKQKRK